MRISIILAHPNPESFNHAIAAAAAEALSGAGHQVTLHDLHRERFDPVLPKEELAPGMPASPTVAAHCLEAAQADGFVIVHPNWWGQPPAILKGWVDRVLRMGLAYKFVVGDNGEGIPVGLLKAQAAVVFNTANTPMERERTTFGDPLDGLWKRCIFDLCGVRKVERRVFSPVITSTPAERERWLAEARALVLRTFPAAGS